MDQEGGYAHGASGYGAIWICPHYGDPQKAEVMQVTWPHAQVLWPRGLLSLEAILTWEGGGLRAFWVYSPQT